MPAWILWLKIDYAGGLYDRDIGRTALPKRIVKKRILVERKKTHGRFQAPVNH
jgi:hypothetical protein